MKLSNLIFINAILYIALGIAFAMYGPVMINLFGMLDMPGAEGATYWFAASFARMFGAALFGFGFLLWAVRGLLAGSAIPVEGVQKTIVALLLGTLFALFVAVIQQWAVWIKPAGWVTIAILVILTIGYAYLLGGKSY